jgi:hypothetical protein
MKKLLLIGLLLLCSCDGSTSKELTTDKGGKVTINGKECEVIAINIGGMAPIFFVDCGPGSSSITYHVGKRNQTVGQYTPPEADAGCLQVTSAEDLKKLEEMKKVFYGK